MSEWRKELYLAIWTNEADKVDDILRRKIVREQLPNIYTWVGNFQDPLHVAARWGRSEAMREMANQGVHIDSLKRYENGDHFTALHWAIHNERVDSIETLLYLEADPSVRGQYGDKSYAGNCWDWVRIKDRPEITNTFDKLFVNRNEDGGKKSLLLAIIDGDVTKVQEILAEENVKNEISNTKEWKIGPLHLAVMRDSEEIFRLILSVINANSIATADSDRTALHEAALWDKTDFMRDLLDAGIDLDLQDAAGRTALHLAVMKGNVANIEALLRRGADITIKDKLGFGPGYLDGGKRIIIEHFGSMDEFKHVIEAYNKDRLYSACVNSDVELFVDECIAKMSPEEVISALNEPRSYTHLWHACKNGNLELVQLIMERTEDLVHREAPDGTTPYLKALLLNHREVTEYFEGKSLSKAYENTLYNASVIKGDSFVTLLTHKHPVFNEIIEEKFRPKTPKTLDEFSKYILDDLCPLNEAIRKVRRSRNNVMLIRRIPNGECRSKCRHKSECLMVKDMIRVVQEIEKEFSSKAPKFKPAFILVGSIAEGTRIGSATELDVTWKFNGLSALVRGEDGYSLKVSEQMDENHPLYGFCDRNVLQFDKFFSFLLTTLDEIIWNIADRIKDVTKGRITIKRGQKSCKMNCPQKDNDEFKGPFYTHCNKCIFNVTQTKSGACLIFNWKRLFNKRKILTIDLIPVLPVQGESIMQLFTLAIKTLLDERPVNWFKHIRGILMQDSVLPESYNASVEQRSDVPLQVGFKLVNYGEDKNNFIIKPAQILGISKHIEDKNLMNIYACVKCIKGAFGVDISSYLIKKILMTNEMQGKIAQNGVENWRKSVFDVLQHPDLKEHFGRYDAFLKWRQKLE